MNLQFPLLILGLGLMSRCGQFQAPAPTITTAPLAPKITKIRQIVPTGPTNFTSEEQGFAVWLPGKPAELKQDAPVPTGETTTNFVFNVRTPEIGFSLSSSPFTPLTMDLIDSTGLDTVVLDFLNGTQKGIFQELEARKFGPHLQKQEEIDVGDFAGRELKVTFFKGNFTLRTRLICTPTGLYALSATGPKLAMQKQAAQIEKVFDSFRILPLSTATRTPSLAPATALVPAATPLSPAAPAPKTRQIVPTGATSFTSKAQGFAVWLPGKPVEDQQSAQLPTGETLTTFYFKFQTPSLLYVVSAAPNPPIFAGLVASQPSALMVDGVQTGIFLSLDKLHLGPHLQKREEVQLDSFPGRELKLSTVKGTITTRVRYFSTPKETFSVSVTGPKAEIEVQRAQIEKVFDSFRILPQ